MASSKPKKEVKFQDEEDKLESENTTRSEENTPYWEKEGDEFHHNVESAFHLSSGRENIRAIVAIEETGRLVRKLAGYNPACPIVAVVNDQDLATELQKLDGVIPLLFDGDLFTPDWRMVDDETEKLDDRVAAAANLLKLQGIAADGDEVVVVTGPRPKCFTGASITCPVTI